MHAREQERKRRECGFPTCRHVEVDGWGGTLFLHSIIAKCFIYLEAVKGETCDFIFL
jgi:hypothetical protein